MEHNIVEVKNLSKTFGSFNAVKDLSFTVRTGDIYGFLGQNGAGKSTTIRMLLGLIKPTAGNVFIDGKDFTTHRNSSLSEIGAVIERPDLYTYMSGYDNLRFFAKLSNKSVGDKRIDEVLQLVGLKGREQDKVKTYSQGMKQRLGIAVALVHDPKLLILDEPTNGLDPQGIVEMRELITTLGKDYGKTVIISSHLLHEIEQVATRMLIINKGKKIVEGNVKELLRPEETLMEVVILSDENIESKLSSSEWKQYLFEHNSSSVIFKMHPDKTPALNRFLVENGVQVSEIRSRHSLEDYFISLTNKANAEAGTI